MCITVTQVTTRKARPIPGCIHSVSKSNWILSSLFRSPKPHFDCFQVTECWSHSCQVLGPDIKAFWVTKATMKALNFLGHQSHVCQVFQITKYRSHVCQVRETDGKAGSALSANSMCAFAVFTVYFFSFMKNKKTNVTWPVNFDLSIDVWSCKWQLDYLRYNQPIIDAHGLDLLRSDGQQTKL